VRTQPDEIQAGRPNGRPPGPLTFERSGFARERTKPVGPKRTQGWLVRRMLVASDVVGLTAAFVAAEVLMGLRGWPIDYGLEAFLFLVTIPAWIAFAKIYGLYDRDEERTNHTTVDELVGVFHLCTVGIWLFFAGGWLLDLEPHPLGKLITFWALSIAFVTAGRSLARTYCRRRADYVQNTLVVGAGEVGQLVARKLLQHEEYGIRVIGFVDRDPRELRPELEGLPVLGSLEELPRIVRHHGVDRVVLAFSSESHADLLEAARSLSDLGVQIDIVPRLFELVGPNVEIRTIEAVPLLGLPPARLARSSRMLKRGLDLVGACVSLIAVAPLFAYIALRIKRDSPGPVLFRQERVGRDMRTFTVFKFRTMHTDADNGRHRDYIRSTMDHRAAPAGNGLYKLDDDGRVTKFGHWLRRTSLDELPQLINVLRGDMSLVGPRPCIPYETEFFAPHHFGRFAVRPGITGLWQVTARAHATFGEALDMDVAYVRGWSLGLDLWLLCRTPVEVLRGKATA
jgi:exopolysaccharide biosynthesis polyprenyl glycosylphosphotransferase